MADSKRKCASAIQVWVSYYKRYRTCCYNFVFPRKGKSDVCNRLRSAARGFQSLSLWECISIPYD